MKFSELAQARRGVPLPIGFALGLLVCVANWSTSALAHGVAAGELQLDHPYAVPSAPGEPHGKAYLRGIKNAGVHPERLLGGSTPVAAKVELHSLKLDANGLRGRPVGAIELPAKTVIKLRHTGDYQLSLIDLKKPLKDGDRFDLTLNFERAGPQTVKVWVQTPRDVAATHSH